MTLPLWGGLEKSADDPCTIEEAIAAAIAAHEADPTAHLGEGESLSAHKHEAVIDHPQGSLRADKFSNAEIVLQPLFEASTRYLVSGYSVSYDIGGVGLGTNNTNGNIARIGAPGQYSPIYYKWDKNITFQAQVSLTNNAEHLAYIMAGGEGVYHEPPGIGFKINAGKLYAIQVVWGEDGVVTHATEIVGASPVYTHMYRVQQDVAEGNIYYYFDGELVATQPIRESIDVGLMCFAFYLKNTSATQNYMGVSGIYLGLQN